ncbi:oligopeptide transporter [Aureobasidium sp. EXF-3400]|nr:oligopeptide transporter [Aureobasidium sp. EXF-12344]KAI4770552.1 oligopeptide transporter [Aureobasidium sp. EXF-3400]
MCKAFCSHSICWRRIWSSRGKLHGSNNALHPVLTDYLQNNIVQTVATAAGGLSNVFVSAMPALYQLKLLTTPLQDFWQITMLTAIGAYFGLFFATPLREFFVVSAARDLKLIFPSSFATATTIRSMHMASGGAKLARQKMKSLSVAFCWAMLSRLVSQFAIGILWDWHPFTWLYLLTGSKYALAFESWGWYIEWSSAFIGSGMLVGMNVAVSFVAGSFLAWGVIGPLLVSKNIAFGKPASSSSLWEDLISYHSLSPEFASPDHPSPRYWLLWPGIACMIAVSFTEIACQWRLLLISAKALCRMILQICSRKRRPSHPKHSNGESNEQDSFKGRIKLRMWLPGLILTLVMACIVLKYRFNMPLSEVLLAMFLAFFFSFLAVQSTGATDITPLTAASKASQVVLGAATKGEGWSMLQAQRLNLIGGALASIGANQAAGKSVWRIEGRSELTLQKDLTGDFRVGFLLGTSPKLQWYAQSIGTLMAVFLAPAIFVLFATAYPCILIESPESCPFAAPSVSAWRAVAVAVTEPDFTIPESSKTFSIVFALFGATSVLIRNCVLTGAWRWTRRYSPNMMIVSLAFLLPSTIYATAMLMGSCLARIWQKKYPYTFAAFGATVAAGLMAGEGIGGAIHATLTLLGVPYERWSTAILCPGDIC